MVSIGVGLFGLPSTRLQQMGVVLFVWITEHQVTADEIWF